MKRLRKLLILGISAALWCAAEAAHPLHVEIQPRYKDVPLIFDSTNYQIFSGQQVSVTRLDFLLSEIALRKSSGNWISLTNWQAFVSLREKKNRFTLPNVPTGSFDRIQFLIGLRPEINHSNPATYSPEHPLNPNVNGLHWSWRDGYVFFALEGMWQKRTATGTLDTTNLMGYSYHIATDDLLMRVELPVELTLTSESSITLVLNVDRLFSGKHRIEIDDEKSSTHSRTGDPLSRAVRENIEQSFSIGTVVDHFQSGPSEAETRPREISATATPYRLTISDIFPRPNLPLDNPLTNEGVELGRKLFFEPLLSFNNKQSCASCHRPEAAFSDPNQAVSKGAAGISGSRNSMALFNLAWKSAFFWDGRTTTLRKQVLEPIQNPLEMNETIPNVVAKLQQAQPNRAVSQKEAATGVKDTRPVGSGYPYLFQQAFGSSDITADRIARALEQFLLTQVAYDSKFDRVLRGEATYTEQEKRGFELFHTEYDPRRGQYGADCFHCHGGSLFQSQSFGNNGLDHQGADPGRYLVTKKEGDHGKFSVPSLRNVDLTAPYMHDGRFRSLEAVVDHYSSGIKRSANLDPNLAKHPDGGVPLSVEDKAALVAFLKTLTENALSNPSASKQPNPL